MRSWLIVSFGASKAGFRVKKELPIFLVVFAVPAAVGLGVWWKTKSG
jgi:hypothetical protein